MTDESRLDPDPGLLADFLIEAREHLATIESLLLALEALALEPGLPLPEDDPDHIQQLFRAFHTLKGMAGFLELAPMQTLAHEVETLLVLVRDGRLACTPLLLDVVLSATDALRQQVDRLESRADVAPPPESLLRRIREAALGDLLLPEASPSPSDRAPAFPHTLTRASRPEAASLRVETAKLDHLLNLAGELAVAQSRLGQQAKVLTSPSASEAAALAANLLQLSLLTRQVQAATQALRMVSASALFQKSARLVRELSRQCAKEVVLELSGERTELDKKIAEDLADPLLHMIRNAIDHGIESPAERDAAGKPRSATLHLAAYHQSGQVVIELADDGRGLNRDRILEKALKRGLIEPHSAARLTDGEVYRLIFEPGFSTAAHVTDLSGRGVGMDVVRAQVERLQGHVEIQSNPGRGTRFLLRLPLTLAILDALIVIVAGRRYLLPVACVRRIFQSPSQPPPENPKSGGPPTVDFEGRELPVLCLHRVFGMPPPSPRAAGSLLVAVEASGAEFCLQADELAGRQDVVIKGLGPLFSQVAGISGCAILGDGGVALILDVEHLLPA